MDNDDAPRRAPAGWLDAMDESDADLAAGRIVPAATVRADLQASIARLEADQLADADRADPAPPEPEQRPAPRRR